MPMHANTTCRGASFSIDILAAGLAVCPSPAGADHQRLQVVGTGKTKRQGAAVFPLDLDLATGDRAAGDEIDQRLRRQGRGIPSAIVAKLTARRGGDAVKVHGLAAKLDGVAAGDGEAVRNSRAVFYDLGESPVTTQ